MRIRAKRCSRCKRLRLPKHFKPVSKYRDGLDIWCADCRREYNREHSRKRRADPAYKDYFRDIDLRKSFGITLVEYNVMLEAQGGVCGICGQEPSTYNLAVDHDHATGEIRGLLCKACNRGLGMFQDDLSLLAAAIHYMEYHS